MIPFFETWQIKFENWKLNSSFKIEPCKLKRALINDRLRFQKYPEVFPFRLYIICSNLPMNFAIFYKK